MTKEEAIKNIKEHCYFVNLIPQAKEALDMAIKALEQPCEDYLIKISKYERIKQLVDEAEIHIMADYGVVCIEGYCDMFTRIREVIKND